MKARRATAQQAIKILESFVEICGKDEIHAAFGWNHAPQVLRRAETLYYFEDTIAMKTGEPSPANTEPFATVGWGILHLNTRDAMDDEASLSAGVFPSFRRRGYWHAIMEWMIGRAKKLGADFCSRTVYKENEEHYNRSMREAHESNRQPSWIYAGDIHFPPPGYSYFVHVFDKPEEAKNGNETTPQL